MLADWRYSDPERDALFVREGKRLVGRFLVRTLEARARKLAPLGSKLKTGVNIKDSAGQRLME